MNEKTFVCQNRKARFEYEILETLEVGIVLKGTEIKSIRLNQVSLDGAYVIVDNGEVLLINCNIEPYEKASINNHESKRSRKLLLHKSEIKKFAEKAAIKGLTLIPLSMYLFNGKAKIELAICRGRKLRDKREYLKEKEFNKLIKN